jgi:hypothetical protein
MHRLAVERHGIFAGTDQDVSRPVGHRLFNLFRVRLIRRMPSAASLARFIREAATLALGYSEA